MAIVGELEKLVGVDRVPALSPYTCDLATQLHFEPHTRAVPDLLNAMEVE